MNERCRATVTREKGGPQERCLNSGTVEGRCVRHPPACNVCSTALDVAVSKETTIPSGDKVRRWRCARCKNRVVEDLK